MIRPDGCVLSMGWDDKQTTIAPEGWRIIALAAASYRFPDLSDLATKRPAAARPCWRCAGSRCEYCFGMGWLPEQPGLNCAPDKDLEIPCMVSQAEEIACRHLRTILAGIPAGEAIPDSTALRKALNGLEWFLPTVLAEIHPEWKGESLDGIYPQIANKIGDGEAEILGLCCLMSDQTVTPIQIRLQLSSTADEVSWLELRLGERGRGGMVRIPYSSSLSIHKRLHALSHRTNPIDWVYQVTFGGKTKGTHLIS